MQPTAEPLSLQLSPDPPGQLNDTAPGRIVMVVFSLYAALYCYMHSAPCIIMAALYSYIASTKILTGWGALGLVCTIVWVDVHIGHCRLVVGRLSVAIRVDGVHEYRVVTVQVDTAILRCLRTGHQQDPTLIRRNRYRSQARLYLWVLFFLLFKLFYFVLAGGNRPNT